MHNEKCNLRARYSALKRIDEGFVSVCRLNDVDRKLAFVEYSDKHAAQMHSLILKYIFDRGEKFFKNVLRIRSFMTHILNLGFSSACCVMTSDRSKNRNLLLA